MRNGFVKCLAVLALAAACSAPAPAYETMPRPEKGRPYPGNNQTVPYEDVLDISDLALTGRVLESGAGVVKIAVERVLRGKLEAKEVEVAYEGEFGEGVLDKDKSVTFFCLRGGGDRLRLAADPPKGGGLVAEGPALVEKLAEAAADPAKGYASNDEAVRLSAAYRLARAWLAAPAEKRPKPPGDLVETLIGGLLPGELRGRNVNAAARNAINLLFDCDINPAFRYSVNAEDTDRQEAAEAMMEAWNEAVKLAAEVRARQAKEAPPDQAAEEARARRLVEQLGSAEWALRQEAHDALRKMGKAAVAAVTAGTASKDAEIGEACKGLVKELSGEKTDPGTGDVTVRISPFTPDKVMPFVGPAPEKPRDAPPDGAAPRDTPAPR